jgi:3,4-dihydroxyphenylacetate 2,3-dioxygenase
MGSYAVDMLAPDIVRAAYASLRVTDLARARWFWVDLLSFHVSEEDVTTLYLRDGDELIHHNLVLRTADATALEYLSFRVRTPDDLARGAEWYGRRGCRTRWFPAGTTPGIGESERVEDSPEFTVELFCQASRVERLIQRYELRHGAEPARIDHFNLVVPDVRQAFEHYRSLGFGCSETIEDESTLYAAWMFRNQTVHDVAFTGGAGPRLHHLGFFTPESHHVQRICDVLGALHAQGHRERGPGRHGVSNAFYVYLRDPDGHRVEIYTSDYYTGDPDHETLRWRVDDPRRRDSYGNDVIPSWYTEAMPVLDLDGKERLVGEIRQTSEVKVGADDFPASPAASSPAASTR